MSGSGREGEEGWEGGKMRQEEEGQGPGAGGRNEGPWVPFSLPSPRPAPERPRGRMDSRLRTVVPRATWGPGSRSQTDATDAFLPGNRRKGRFGDGASRTSGPGPCPGKGVPTGDTPGDETWPCGPHLRTLLSGVRRGPQAGAPASSPRGHSTPSWALGTPRLSPPGTRALPPCWASHMGPEVL